MNGQTRDAPHPPPTLWQAMADAAPTPVVLIAGPRDFVLYSNRIGHCLAHDPAAFTSRAADEVFPAQIVAAIEQVRRSGQAFNLTGLALPPACHRATATVWDITLTPVASTGVWDITLTPVASTGAPTTSRETPCILLIGHDVTHHVTARHVTAQGAAEQAQDAPNRLPGERPGGRHDITEARLRAVLQQIPAAIFIIDSAECATPFQNDRLAQLLGNADTRDHGETSGTPCGWAQHQDGTPYRPDEYPSRRAFSQAEAVEAEPMIYRRADGEVVHLEVSAAPIRDAEGGTIAGVSVVCDVTERNRQADALRESEERLRAAIGAGGLGTWEIDLVQGSMQMDEAFATMLGLPDQRNKPGFQGSRDEGRGFIHPEDIDSARAALEAAIAARGQLRLEIRAIARDGRILWLACSGRVVLDCGGRPLRVAGVVRDVTDRRLREEALEDAVASRELLLREADHRIKNSLQLVGSVLSLQKTRLAAPELSAALDDAVSRVQAVAEAHRALHQSADLRSVDFGTMLNDLCHHAARLSPAVIFTSRCPAQIDLDTERAIPLGLLISELLTNAAKYAYGAAGGPVAVSAVAAGREITIRVSDRGRGIRAEAGDGRGIGSTIIAAIARQIGAIVETSSGPDGTTVTLTFARLGAA
jgi:PAS domain S-box-containing protein